MPKIKKLKRRKKFRANVNRKRLRNKLNKLPNIECQQIKEAWESRRSTVKNLEEMGLAYDPNQILKLPNVKKEMLRALKDNEENESDIENIEEPVTKKIHVAKSLEEEAKCPRARLFRLPNNEVHFVTYMMDKYSDDYKAMARDRKNYNQLTWRQIKNKIEKFKSIPEQYAEYLVQKGDIVLDDPTPLKKIKPEIFREPTQKKPNAKPTRRKRQQSKSIQSIWQEESIDDTVGDFSISKAVDDVNEEKITKDNVNSEKKLKLFSDDECDDDDDENNDDDDNGNNFDDDDSSEEEDIVNNTSAKKTKISLQEIKRKRKKTPQKKAKV